MSSPASAPAEHPLGPLTSPGGSAGVLAGNAVALMVIVGSWYGTSGEGSMRASMAWVNLAALGVAIGGAANGLFLRRGRRVLQQARSEIAARIRPTAKATSEPGAERLVSGANMTRFHRPDCPLVIGKRCQPGDEATFARQHRRRCEVCEP